MLSALVSAFHSRLLLTLLPLTRPVWANLAITGAKMSVTILRIVVFVVVHSDVHCASCLSHAKAHTWHSPLMSPPPGAVHIHVPQTFSVLYPSPSVVRQSSQWHKKSANSSSVIERMRSALVLGCWFVMAVTFVTGNRQAV